MSIFNFFKNNKDKLDIPDKYSGCDIYTLEELAKSGNTYWKFTQSQKGMSSENVYINCEKGKITEAIDKEEWLSFVRANTIAACLGYGDQLTKFVFDLSDPLFSSIKNEIVIKKNTILELDRRKIIILSMIMISIYNYVLLTDIPII